MSQRPAALLACLLAACGATATAPPAAPSPGLSSRPASADELVRVRCASDGAEVITTWDGAIYAFVPGEGPRHLFDVTGMNVARCLRGDDGWHLTSRELLYYLDPATGEALHRWTDPWTGREVPVVHVANDLVQGGPFGEVPMRVAGDTATIVLDIPISYPNALARDPALARYAPAPSYQAGEFFSLSAPAAEVIDASRAQVSAMTLTWHRIGPWLPWMDAGDRAGYLVYSAHGERVASLDALPPLLRRELDERMPRFRHAPACRVDRRNVTSWSYFAANLAAYQAGERFPLPAPEDPGECAATGAARPADRS